MTAAQPSCLAVIPARGGSKGIPRKNVRLLAGKPLIAYTIEEAKRSRLLGRIVVSTEDQEIAEISRELGAEVVVRPSELAADDTPTESALLHVLEALKRTEGYVPDAVATLEPTSPLRTHELIDRCITELRETGADTVLTVLEMRSCLGRLADGAWTFLEPDQPRRRQDRRPLYAESSTVYVTKTATLLRTRSIIGQRLRAVVVSSEEAVDINTVVDFVVAEALVCARQQR